MARVTRARGKPTLTEGKRMGHSVRGRRRSAPSAGQPGVRATAFDVTALYSFSPRPDLPVVLPATLTAHNSNAISDCEHTSSQSRLGWEGVCIGIACEFYKHAFGSVRFAPCQRRKWASRASRALRVAQSTRRPPCPPAHTLQLLVYGVRASRGRRPCLRPVSSLHHQQGCRRHVTSLFFFRGGIRAVPLLPPPCSPPLWPPPCRPNDRPARPPRLG